MTEVLQQKRESTGDRREAIAAAARALIVEKGFEGFRTRDIAERVGINIATLHYHVPSKDALIRLVAQSMHDDFRAQGLRHPRAGMTPLQQLRREIADYRETITETPELIQVFGELLIRANRDPNVRDVITPLHDYWLGQIESILADGAADGSFRADLDPAAGAHMITGALKTIGRAPNTLADFDRVAAEIERAFVNPATQDIAE